MYTRSAKPWAKRIAAHQTRHVKVLDIPVSAELLSSWQRWLAPEVQPFFVDSLRGWPKSMRRERSLSSELRDTYQAWRIDRSLEILWLDEACFHDMSRAQRMALLRAQVDNRRGAVPSVRRWSDVLDPEGLRARADGHRFLWWPSLVAASPGDILSRVVRAGPNGDQLEAPASRHREVARATWHRCAEVLPNARRLGGSFPAASGPNCFGTVLAAAGVEADSAWIDQPPFDAWLDGRCRSGGADDEPGTVLVWRDRSGKPVHAAVTIGDGWALEKGSQDWWTPRAVRAVGEVIRTSRTRGQRLERHHIAPRGD